MQRLINATKSSTIIIGKLFLKKGRIIMKKKFIGILLASMILSASNTSIADDSKKVQIDELTEGYKIVKDSLMISESEFEKEYGYKVNSEGDIIKFEGENNTFEFNALKHEFKIGDKSLISKNESKKIDGQIYLPYRPLMYSIGYVVDWNDSERSVMTKKDLKEDKFGYDIKVLAGPTAVSFGKAILNENYLGFNADYKVEVLNQPKLASASILSKEADVITVPSNMAAILHNKGAEYEVAGTIIWGNLYLASSENISSVSELKGKDIYLTGKNATPDILLQKILRDNGLNPQEDVNLIYLPGPQDLASYAISGKAKIAVLPEPIMTKAGLKNNSIKEIYDFQKYWKDTYKTEAGYPQTIVFVNKEFKTNYPNAYQTLVYTLENDIRWMNENVEAAATIGEKLGIGLTAPILKKALPRSNFFFESSERSKEDLKDYLKALYEFDPKTIGGKIPDESFWRE